MLHLYTYISCQIFSQNVGRRFSSTVLPDDQQHSAKTNLITTLVKYYKFFTLKTNNNLTISYGLLSTKTTMMSPNKVQIFSYTQNWLQKKIDLCNILIFQASSEMNMSEKSNEGSQSKHDM